MVMLVLGRLLYCFAGSKPIRDVTAVLDHLGYSYGGPRPPKDIVIENSYSGAKPRRMSRSPTL